MANDFTKQELIAFDKYQEGFDKELDLSMNIAQFTPGPVELERAISATYQRRQPKMAEVIDGFDISGETADDLIDRFVPGFVNKHKNVFFNMNAKELRDPMQMDDAIRSSRRQLAAQVEVDVAEAVANQAAIVIKRNVPTGYADLARCETAMRQRGIQAGDWSLYLNSEDNASMADNLASRQTINQKPTTAMERSRIGNMASFKVGSVDLLPTITGSASTGVTVNGAVTAHTVAVMADNRPVDNRYQDITLSASHGLVVGDAIQIDGVDTVHVLTKQPTGRPYTFRVYGVSGNTVTINAMVTAGPYQNVTAVPADSAAVTVLNNETKMANVFWTKDSVELAKGSIDTSTMNGAGLSVRSATTPQGIQLVMAKQAGLKTFKVETRLHIYYDVNVLDPTRCGLMLCNQTGAVN